MSIWSVILIFWQWLAYLDYLFCYLFYGYLLVQKTSWHIEINSVAQESKFKSLLLILFFVVKVDIFVIEIPPTISVKDTFFHSLPLVSNGVLQNSFLLIAWYNLITFLQFFKIWNIDFSQYEISWKWYNI